MADIIVRPARPEDKAAWRDMRAALYGEDPSLLTDVEGYFAGDPMIAAAFIAQDGSHVGFVELSLRNYAEGCVSSPVPYVEGLYVAQGARRRNVGRLLIAAAEDWARTNGFTEMASDTQIENEASLGAHQAYGFSEVERIACLRKRLD
ncbi:GNAT family N-acetyltransferase [Nordella sp. HKS 07]|uniref:GNAT family N-acetyltransferase n=1 Tax=Nordella sp. HKS 07 TaxID=2712222 RepID=UPI0013E13D89|nr:GNAT family N-acetyltransferase [Nordella sp. HKS 07]QIG51918.1 GNAT family N-acetyltransferase [Nordella sp. HKS 07]